MNPTTLAATRPRRSRGKRAQTLLARWFGLGLLHLIGKTTWATYVNKSVFDDCRRQTGKPSIIVIWHSSLLPLLYWGSPARWAPKGLCTVASQSADGDIVADIASGLGVDTVRGSSSRGGARVMMQLARKLRSGADVCIAVDGPKGPAFKVKPGVILLAKMTGATIVPVVTCAKRYWQFQSWDRMRLPLPLNRILLQASEPIHIDADADDEAVEAERLNLESVLTRHQTHVDDRMKPFVLRLPDRKPRDKRPAV